MLGCGHGSLILDETDRSALTYAVCEIALLRSIHALKNESELATNVTGGEQGGWLDGVLWLVLWCGILCFHSSLLSFCLWLTLTFGRLSTNPHSQTTVQQLGDPAAPAQAPSLDWYFVVHVAATCDEHGVCVTKDSAGVNQFDLRSVHYLPNIPVDQLSSRPIQFSPTHSLTQGSLSFKPALLGRR